MQQSYLAAYGPGTRGWDAFMDGCKFAHEFDLAVRTHDEAMIMVGMRRFMYRMWKYLALEPDDMVKLYVHYVRELNQGDG